MHTSSSRVALAGMLALAIAMGIGRFAFTPILPQMQQAHGLGLAAAGWLAAANYAGYLVGAVGGMRFAPAAPAAVRGGLLVVGVTTLAMAFTRDLGAWLVLRFTAGVASAFVLVFASAWCLERLQAEESPATRALRGATLFAGVGVGIAFAGITCLLLVRVHASPDAAWLALGVASFAVGALVWPAFADARVAASAVPGDGPRRWDGERLRLVACYGAFGFGYIIPATFIAAMTRELEAGYPPAWHGWVWPLFGAAAAASTFAAAALRRRLSDRALWAASHLAMAAGVVAPLMVPGLAGYILSAVLVGGTFMVATMAGIQEARRIAGAQARPLIAAMTAAFAVGQIAGPLFVAAFEGRYTAALAAAAAMLAASAVTLLIRTTAQEAP